VVHFYWERFGKAEKFLLNYDCNLFCLFFFLNSWHFPRHWNYCLFLCYWRFLWTEMAKLGTTLSSVNCLRIKRRTRIRFKSIELIYWIRIPLLKRLRILTGKILTKRIFRNAYEKFGKISNYWGLNYDFMTRWGNT
jgi:hypothetical protein